MQDYSPETPIATPTLFAFPLQSSWETDNYLIRVSKDFYIYMALISLEQGREMIFFARIDQWV